MVNVDLFVALGAAAGQPWLALAGFVALALVLRADFNVTELFREARAAPAPTPLARNGSRAERVAAAVYRVLFAPQDRAIRGFVSRRLDRVLGDEPDAARRTEATRAYHDRATLVVLANLGLSTQLVALGACLALGAPAAYLWLVVVQAAALPLLQLRRERLAQRTLAR